MNSLPEHDGPVTALATSPTLGDIATVCDTKPHKSTSSKDSCSILSMYCNGWSSSGRIGFVTKHSIWDYTHTHVQSIKLHFLLQKFCFSKSSQNMDCYTIIHSLISFLFIFFDFCRRHFQIYSPSVDYKWFSGGEDFGGRESTLSCVLGSSGRTLCEYFSWRTR